MKINLKKIIPEGLRGKLMYGLSFLPDEAYIKLFYFAVTGRKLDLKNPVTFEDKQQWLKLHDRHEEYTMLADKYAVKKLVGEKLGEQYCFPLLGVWDRFEDIDFDALPDEFVLKCNHDSGSTRVIHDKKAITPKEMKEMRKFYKRRLRKNFFYAGREYPYKNIEHKIMAEKYMSDETQDDSGLNDYKFFCFHGVPKFVLIVSNRGKGTCYDFFDMDLNRLTLTYGEHKNENLVIDRDKFNEMAQIAAKMSEGIKFVRLDLFMVNGQVYFGEYTFFDGGGFQWYQPEEWEYTLGEWIDLSKD